MALWASAHFADSVQCSAAGSGERLLLVTSLSKECFVSSRTHSSYSARKACDLLYVCVDLFPAITPLLLMLRWRSIVFVLYVNVYQRVPTVNASTHKVMYWHGRFLRDGAELSVCRGCAAEGWGWEEGRTQQSWRGRSMLLSRTTIPWHWKQICT